MPAKRLNTTARKRKAYYAGKESRAKKVAQTRRKKTAKSKKTARK